MQVKHAPVMIALCLGTACRPAAHPVDCAVKPADFRWFRDAGPWGIDPIFNVIEVRRDGRIAWNGSVLTGHQLDNYLATSAELNPQPRAALTFDGGVDCAAVDRVRAAMRRHLACGSSHSCLQGVPAP